MKSASGPQKTSGLKKESRRSTGLSPLQANTALLPPVTAADRIILEIRKFLMHGVFTNAQAAERVGLGLTDMQLLHMLQLYGPSTPSRIAASTGLSSGGVTVALDRLEKAGYVRREHNPADRRSLLIHLVPACLLKLYSQYEDIEASTRRQLATLSMRDLEAVIRFFEAMQSVRTDRP